MRKLLSLAMGAILTLCLAADVQAGAIYAINAGVSSHGMVQNAINHLNSVGHTVSTGGTLSDYSAYNQVWDLRYNGTLGAADITAMGSYMQNGGRMYLTGEHSGFDSRRNNSLVSFISAIGGGAINFVGDNTGAQYVTSAGQMVNNPNNYTTVNYSAARQSASAGSGFLVTTAGSAAGTEGSLVGWDFGQIAGKSSARMLAGFDIEIFQNGVGWTENMATFLDGAGSPVPEPTSIAFWSLAAAGAAVCRRRHRKSLKKTT